MSDSLQPHGLYSPWNSPSQNTGVGSHSLLQGIFPTKGSNPGFLHLQADSSPAESPGTLYSNMYMSISSSQFIPPSHRYPLATISLFSTSLTVSVSVDKFMCTLFYIPGISDTVWYSSFSRHWFLLMHISIAPMSSCNWALLKYSLHGSSIKTAFQKALMHAYIHDKS